MERGKPKKEESLKNNEEVKLPLKTKMFYGIGDIGNAIINSAIQFYLLKFYTDIALILPVLAGNALLIGKIWDAINDPLFGWLTDKTDQHYAALVHTKRFIYNYDIHLDCSYVYPFRYLLDID